jgi:hypothetical protein
MTTRPNLNLHCSFCAQGKSEVSLLFQGLGALAPHICDGCVALFADVAALDRIDPVLATRAVAQRNGKLARPSLAPRAQPGAVE